MEKLFERLNLYDILAMICPGGLLLLAILSTDDVWGGVKEISWIQHVLKQTILSRAFCFGCLGLLLSYLLGIVIHTLVTLWRVVIERYIGIWRLVMHIAYKHEIKVKESNKEKEIFQILNKSLSEIDFIDLQSVYFDAHSYARTTKGAVLLAIEQQVAMLRNSIIPCVWLMVIALSQLGLSICAITGIVLGYLVVCGIIIWIREYKLFTIVLLTSNIEENK